MVWFKGFGKQQRNANSSKRRGKPQTFILEPILTPSGLVDDPTQTPPLELWAPDPNSGHDLPPDLLAWMNAVAQPNSAPSPFNGGVFTVGASGVVEIDYLYDGGGYQGELAVFSLAGMEHYTPGSTEFIAEAARRALSDSTLGHIVIQDAVEGAHFSGTMAHEGNFNCGDYRGSKSVWMQPGTQFGVMLVPNGSVAQVLATPDAAGALRPLFSLSTANPHDALGVGQIVDLTGEGHTFGMEDLRIDGASDRDYNDAVFRIKGANSNVLPAQDFINPLQDWRSTDLGADILTPPAPTLPLVGIIDTGYDPALLDQTPGRIILGSDTVDGDPNPLVADPQSHGTGVLSVIGASQTQPLPIESQIAPTWIGRGVGSGNWAASLVEFVDYAVAQGETGAVVNLSFELTTVDASGNIVPRFELTPQERSALHYAHAHQVLVVVSAGNRGGDLSALAQAATEFDNIISVGAVDGETRAAYSNFGAGLSLLAPGGTPDAPLAIPTAQGSTAVSGTSYASAQVTGAISLIWQANPALNYQQVVEILQQSATDLATPGWDAATGFGVLNVLGAVELAQRTPGLPLPAASPSIRESAVTGQGVAGAQASNGTTPLPGNAQSLAGNSHILWRNIQSGVNTLWQMQGAQYQSSVSLPSASAGWTLAGAGDFNRDGYTDILWRNPTSGTNAVWYMNGNHSLSGVTLPTTAGATWSIAGVGDFNADGNPDILWRQSSSNTVGVWYMNGISLMSTASFPNQAAPEWTIGGVADFNRDGQPDLLWRNQAAGTTGVWYLNGTSLLSTAGLSQSPSSSWSVSDVGDFNRDGQADILWYAPSTGQSTIWLMNGVNYQSSASLPTVATTWRSEALFRSTLPTVPTEITLSGSPGTISNTVTPTIRGKADPYARVMVHRQDGVAVGQALADGQDNWQLTTTALAQGVHRLTARAVDAAGVSSFVSNPLNLTIATVPPTLSLTQPQPGSTLSPSARLVGTVSGTGTNLATLHYQFNGQPAKPIAVNANGSFDQAIDFTGMSNGHYTLTLTAVDQAGWQTTRQVPVTVEIASSAELVRDTAPQNSFNQDRITFDPTIKGKIVSEQALVQLVARFANAPNTEGVDVTAAFNPTTKTFTLNAVNLARVYGKPLPDGTHTLEVKAKAQDGTWTPVLQIPFTLDRPPPAAPTGLSVIEATAPAIAGILHAPTPTPTVTGLAEVGSRITVWINGQPQPQSVITAADGRWQLTLPQSPDGILSITTTATDVAGNTSQPSEALVIRVLTGVPGRPTIRLAPTSDTGLSKTDGITTATNLVLTGTATPGAQVQVLDTQSNSALAETVADASGVWTAPLYRSVGTHSLTAKATNPGTNTSQTSLPTMVTIQTQAPPEPRIDTIVASSDSGSSSRDRITKNDTPTLQGWTTPNTQVQLFTEDGKLVGQTMTTATGNWQITPVPLDPGIRYLKAVATDTAGNPSTASTPFEFAISENDGLWQGNGYGTYDDVWKTVDLSKLKPPGDEEGDPLPPPASSPNPDPAASVPGVQPPTDNDYVINFNRYIGYWFGSFDRRGRIGGFSGWDTGVARPYNPQVPATLTSPRGEIPGLPSEYLPHYYDGYYGQEPPLDPDGNPYYGSPSDPNAPPLSPPRPKPNFMEKVGIILDELRPKLLPNSQTAFDQEKDSMLALGRVIDQHGLYQIAGTFGLYGNANAATTRNAAKGSASSVAEAIRTATTPTLGSIYLTKLNLAAKLSNKDALKQSEVEPALQKLSEAYSKLRVKSAEKVPLDQNPSAFERLWQAKDESALNSAIQSFQTIFQNVGQPKQAIQFLTNWLEAAGQVPSLKAELEKPKFLDEWMQLGITIAQLNLEQAQGSEPLWSFVDTLWQAKSAGEVRLGATQLNKFFKEAKTPEQRLKLVQFSDNLIQAAKLAPSTQRQVKDPRFVDALIGLGGAYAAINPNADDTTNQEAKNFLHTMYSSSSEISFQNGSRKLEQFLTYSPSENLELLKYSESVYNFIKLQSKGQENVQIPSSPGFLSEEPGSGLKEQPPQLKGGTLAHSLIGAYYRSFHPSDAVIVNAQEEDQVEVTFLNNFPVSTILRSFESENGVTVNYSRVTDAELRKRPDITNVTKQELYEIKPSTNRQLRNGERQRDQYLSVFNRALGVGYVKAGSANDPGSYGSIPIPGKSDELLVFAPIRPGLILYRVIQVESNTDPQFSLDSIIKTVTEVLGIGITITLTVILAILAIIFSPFFKSAPGY